MAIPAPILDIVNLRRDGRSGSVPVTNVDPDHFVEVWGSSNLLPTWERRARLGERQGEGVVDLDYSKIMSGSAWPAILFAVSRDAAGNYSPPSEDPGPAIITDSENPIRISLVRRNAVGDQVLFQVAGLAGNDRSLIWFFSADGEAQSKLTENGANTIAELRPDQGYDFLAFTLLASGRVCIPAKFGGPAVYPDGSGMTDLLAALSTALAAEGTLQAYNEIIAVQGWRDDGARLPAFDRYAIVLSPDSERVDSIAIGSKQKVASIGIYLLVYNFDEALSLTGTEAGEVGILQMHRDVMAALRGNSLHGLVDLVGDEFDDTVDLNQVAANDRYYRWVRIGGTFRLPAYSE